jgi:hypothetical protein
MLAIGPHVIGAIVVAVAFIAAGIWLLLRHA